MANRGRIWQLPDDLIGNQGLPSRVVSNERLEMLQQQIRRNTHVRSLRHHFGSSAWRSGDEVAYGGNYGIGRFLPEPVAHAGDHGAADVRRDQFGLVD